MLFADSFWTPEYDRGFKVLFEQLHDGCKENDDFVALFSQRMEAEMVYGTQLEDMESLRPGAKRMNSDDYVLTIKNAYQKVNENFVRQGHNHLQIATNIRVMVLEPFTNWCHEHRKRVEFSEQTLGEKYKAFRSQKQQVERLQKKYFNKCRMLEEFKLHYSEDELQEELKDLEFAAKQDVAPKDLGESAAPDDLQYRIYKFGNSEYDYVTIKGLLLDILSGVEVNDHKVPILGTYRHVLTGLAITQWLLDNIPDFNIAKAEKFGQDLINNGFIRLIGTMLTLKNFINSLQFYYQWKPVVFEITGAAIDKPSEQTGLSRDQLIRALQFTEYFEDMKQAMGVGLVDYTDRSQLARLMAEVKLYDANYFNQVCELDKVRCEFEELVMDHLTFMQKCELDRLKAVKKVTHDFMSAFSDKVEHMKHMCDELSVVEETMNPISDLKFLIENYGTGRFNPLVILYDNYYNSNINQTFGVDLAVKLRLDKKVVPILIQCLLSHLDKVYPEVANDEERINLWTKPINLLSVHKLRLELNPLHDPALVNDVLQKHHPIIITNVLKLYLMELPDLLIPHSNLELIHSLYQTYPVLDESKSDPRIVGVQNVLLDLPLCNLATLDAVITHLKRLVLIIGSKNPELSKKFQTTLLKEFSPLVLKPRDVGDTSGDKHVLALVNDLFTHKDDIFKELRRRTLQKPAGQIRPATTRIPLVPLAQLPSRDNLTKSRLELRLQQAVKPKRIVGEIPAPVVRKISSSKELKVDPSDVPSLPKPKKPASPVLLTLSDEEFADAQINQAAEEKASVLSGSPKRSSLERSLPKKEKKERKDKKDKDRTPTVVSSKPTRKDFSMEKPGQFRSLGRKGSVKDLASKFDLELLRLRLTLPVKLSKRGKEVIEVED